MDNAVLVKDALCGEVHESETTSYSPKTSEAACNACFLLIQPLPSPTSVPTCRCHFFLWRESSAVVSPSLAWSVCRSG